MLNFYTNEIRITKTLYNENNNMKEYELTPPKTEGSIHTINTEDEITESHHKRQMKIKMKYRHEIEDYPTKTLCSPDRVSAYSKDYYY
jgi:hypothetical protein